MKFTPHPYQQDAICFLLSQRYAGLLLDMGMGKTVISLYAAKLLIDSGAVKRVLLISPIRPLYTVWPLEIEKWDELKGLTYHNWHESRLAIRDLPKVHIYGINPESALTLFKQKAIFNMGFDMLIIDEAHNFKNYDSQRFKHLKPWLYKFAYRWILTGTFAPNNLEDLWAQVYILDRGASLGEYITHFRNKYCVPDRSGYSYQVIPAYRQLVYEAVAPIVMRLSAKDHLDMPELVYNEVPVILPKEAMRVYKDMEKELIALLDSGVEIMSPNAAVAGMRCRQIANGGIYLPDGTAEHIHTAKMEALKDIVAAQQGQPLLVFYEFIHDVHRIKAALGDVPNLTASKHPEKLIREFNEGKHPVLIGHPASIGVGLNLQGACSHVCWIGVPWDLALYDQANARVYRQGQEADRVIIHHLMAQNTMDQLVLKALERKGREQQDLFDAIQSIRNRSR